MKTPRDKEAPQVKRQSNPTSEEQQAANRLAPHLAAIEQYHQNTGTPGLALLSINPENSGTDIYLISDPIFRPLFAALFTRMKTTIEDQEDKKPQ